VKRVLWLGLAVAIAAGCGGDDGDDKDGGDRAETPSAGSDLARFESPRIAFTFEYPEDFIAEKRPRERVLARVGIERGSRLNAIKVRRTANSELEPDRYLDEFQRDFERTVGAVEKRRERVGDLDTGVLEFEDSVKRGGETVGFKSSSYFFKGGGQTWQLECIADDEHRDEIDGACRTALESVNFAR
jgi:hypothetical protein